MPSISSFSIHTVGVLLQIVLVVVTIGVLTLFSRDFRAWWLHQEHRREQLRLLWMHGTIRKPK